MPSIDKIIALILGLLIIIGSCLLFNSYIQDKVILDTYCQEQGYEYEFRGDCVKYVDVCVSGTGICKKEKEKMRIDYRRQPESEWG